MGVSVTWANEPQDLILATVEGSVNNQQLQEAFEAINAMVAGCEHPAVDVIMEFREAKPALGAVTALPKLLNHVHERAGLWVFVDMTEPLKAVNRLAANGTAAQAVTVDSIGAAFATVEQHRTQGPNHSDAASAMG